MESTKKRGGGDEDGVQVVSAGDFLYSRIKPKHLRDAGPKFSVVKDTERGNPVGREVDSESADRTNSAEGKNGGGKLTKGVPRLLHSSMQELSRRCSQVITAASPDSAECSRRTRPKSCQYFGGGPTMDTSYTGNPGRQSADSREWKSESYQTADDQHVRQWIEENDNDSNTDDGYCGMRINSSSSVEKLEKKPLRQNPREQWVSVRSKDKGRHQDTNPDGNGIVREEDAEQKQLCGRIGSYVDLRETKQDQEQHPEMQNFATIGHQEERRKHSLTLEEGCMLTFPHTRKESGTDRQEKSDRQTEEQNTADNGNSGDNPSSVSSDDTKRARADGSAMQTTESGPDGTVEREEGQTSFSSESTENIFGSGDVSQYSLQHSRGSSIASLPSLYGTRRDSSAADATNSQTISVLQTCSACLRPSSELTLMQCFHLVCPSCIVPIEDDHVQCGVCKAEQAAPQDGITSLNDIFPGLLAAISSFAQADSHNETKSDKIVPEHPASEDPAQQAVFTTSEKPENSEIDFGTGFQTTEIVKDNTNAPSSQGRTSSYEQSEDGGVEDGIRNRGRSEEHEKSLECKASLSRKEKPPLEKQRNLLSGVEDKTNSDTGPGNLIHDNSSVNNDNSITNTSVTITVKVDSSNSDTPVNNTGKDNDNTTTERQTCGACQEEAETQHVCVTCGGIWLCGGCRTAHLHLPITRSHNVVAIASSPLSPLTLLSRHQPVCPTHGQDLALQCCTCGVFLCHRCLVPQHSRHEVHELGNIHHTGRKQFSGLQRTVKQHMLAARSSRRAVDEQMQKLSNAKQHMCDSIQAWARMHVDRIMLQAEELSSQVEGTAQARQFLLAKTQSDIQFVQKEGEKLRSVLEAVSEDTPHLTSLILRNTCQARFDGLRKQVSLRVEEFDDVVFRPNAALEGVLGKESSLGTVRVLASGLPDTSMQILGTFNVGGEVSSLAVSPYNELVCVLPNSKSCSVYDDAGVMLFDISRHVIQPSDVQVTPGGIFVILGCDGSRKGRLACLTLLSPSGSLLSRLPLQSEAEFTHIHCSSDTQILVSDEINRTVTLYTLENIHKPHLRVVRSSCHEKLLQSPRHVSINLTGDWLINERGSFLRVVSPEGHVTTALTDDEPEAVLQPPRSSRRKEGCQPKSIKRLLTSVCCDSRGRMMAVDSGKNGLYIATGGSSGNGERHFVQLQELTSSGRVTAMTIDQHDRLIMGTSDGTIIILKVGLDE